MKFIDLVNKVVLLSSILRTAYGTLSVSEKTACVKWDYFVVGSCYRGKYLNNGTCTKCPEGTFMPYYNTCPECFQFRACEVGQEVLYNGDFKHDRICGDFKHPVTELPAHDGPQLTTSNRAEPSSPSEADMDSHDGTDHQMVTTPSPGDQGTVNPSSSGPCSWNDPVRIVLLLTVIVLLFITGVLALIRYHRCTQKGTPDSSSSGKSLPTSISGETPSESIDFLPVEDEEGCAAV